MRVKGRHDYIKFVLRKYCQSTHIVLSLQLHDKVAMLVDWRQYKILGRIFKKKKCLVPKGLTEWFCFHPPAWHL